MKVYTIYSWAEALRLLPMTAPLEHLGNEMRPSLNGASLVLDWRLWFLMMSI